MHIGVCDTNLARVGVAGAIDVTAACSTPLVVGVHLAELFVTTADVVFLGNAYPVICPTRSRACTVRAQRRAMSLGSNNADGHNRLPARGTTVSVCY